MVKIRRLNPENMKDKTFLINLGPTDRDLSRLYRWAFGTEVRFAHDSKKWYIWDGNKWSSDDVDRITKLTDSVTKMLGFCIKNWPVQTEEDVAVKKKLKAIEERSKSRRAIANALCLMSSEPRIAVRESEFDQDAFLLGVSNGTVNLRSGELMPSKKEHYITKVAKAKFSRHAGAPNWEKFLFDIFEGDVEIIGFVQRAIGYALTGDTREQKFFIFLGPTNTGKSVLLEVIKELMGEYGVSVDMSTFIAARHQTPNAPRGDIVRLSGSRFACSTEGEENQQFAVSLIKRLTGQDTLSARALFQEAREVKPTCKIFMATNQLPDISATEQAFWRRAIIIPCYMVIDEDREKLRRNLLNELPGILNWAIEGCIKWQKEGLKIPDAIQKFTQNIREEYDLITEFINEMCVIDRTQTVLSRDLYAAYCKWCSFEGIEPITQKSLIRTVKMRFRCESVREAGTGRKMLRGIGLRPRE